MVTGQLLCSSGHIRLAYECALNRATRFSNELTKEEVLDYACDLVMLFMLALGFLWI